MEALILSGRGEGRSVPNPLGGAIEFKVRAEETAGALTALETAGPREKARRYTRMRIQDEVIYFLEGRFRLKIEDTVRDAPSGSFAFIPKGVPHTWQNVDDAPGRLLVMFMPGAPEMERFFERFSAVAADDGSVAGAFATLADPAGMKVLGPPLAQSDPVS